MIGRSLDRTDLIVLGLSGGLLHVWNHALFKALLFLSAGSVIHAAHTREIDELGGLAKRMPWTALCFLVGAVAICGLPPLNGFVSEFLIYLGLFNTLGQDGQASFAGAAFAAPALALIGALAVACFVKVYGIVFLGVARSEHAAAGARVRPSTMIGPMGVLVACCFFIGLAPSLVAPILGQGHRRLGTERDRSGQPSSLRWRRLNWITVDGSVLDRGAAARRHLSWRCAIAPRRRRDVGHLGLRIHGAYAEDAVHLVVRSARCWSGCLPGRCVRSMHRPHRIAAVSATRDFHSEVDDTVLDEAVLPTFRFGARLFSWFRVFQQGSIQTLFAVHLHRPDRLAALALTEAR